MPKSNKKCCLCKEEYYYCSHCPGKSPAFMLTFCSQNCKDIYVAVAGYAAGDMTKEQAARELKKCDLSRMEKYTPSNKKLIKEILGESTAEKAEVKPVAAKPAEAVTAKPTQTATPKPAVNPARDNKPVMKPTTPEKK